MLAGSLGSNDHNYSRHAGFGPKGMAGTEENAVSCCCERCHSYRFRLLNFGRVPLPCCCALGTGGGSWHAPRLGAGLSGPVLCCHQPGPHPHSPSWCLWCLVRPVLRGVKPPVLPAQALGGGMGNGDCGRGTEGRILPLPWGDGTAEGMGLGQSCWERRRGAGSLLYLCGASLCSSSGLMLLRCNRLQK